MKKFKIFLIINILYIIGGVSASFGDVIDFADRSCAEFGFERGGSEHLECTLALFKKLKEKEILNSSKDVQKKYEEKERALIALSNRENHEYLKALDNKKQEEYNSIVEQQKNLEREIRNQRVLNGLSTFANGLNMMNGSGAYAPQVPSMPPPPLRKNCNVQKYAETYSVSCY